MRNRSISSLLLALVAIASLAGAACTIENQDAPPLMGPSTLGLSVTMAASPDTLRRDGSSVSTVRIVVRDAQGPVSGQVLHVGADGGSLSSGEVVTGADGAATVEITAPSIDSPLTSIQVTATAVGSNAQNAFTHSVAIALAGPSVPVASFTFTPSSPGQFDLVTFDASATTVGGSACNSGCTYTWNFGDGASATGQTATHRFESQGTFTVTLRATSSQGATGTTSQTVSVGVAQVITAAIDVSPNDPGVGETVRFSGARSTTPDGTAIAEYTWDFGNGETATGESVSTTYTLPRTFTVILRIRDELGRTAVATETVSVDEAAP